MGSTIDLVSTDAGVMRAYQALPASGKGPVVVVLQEIFGVNAAMRHVADDLAAHGYVALVPDMFWRLEPGIELGYVEEDHKKAFGYWQRFDLEHGIADAAAAIEAARHLPAGTGKVGVWGFCLGGQLAIRAGARAKPDAILSFYGVKLDQSLDEIASLACPTHFHFGEADAHIPATTRAAIGALAETKPNLEMHVYPEAVHAFFNQFRPVGYHASAHALSRTRALDMLQQALPVA